MDPFGDPFAHIHHQMRAMDQMSNAMMNDAFSMLTGFGHRSMHPMLGFGGDQNMQRNRMIENDMMMSPFGGLGGPFGGGLLGPSLFGGMMGRMENLSDHAMNDPNSMVFAQSTSISYDGNGPPKVVQQSTRKAGNSKETRRQVQDGDEAELMIGHSIGDRSHIIEKKRDKDGKTRQQQRFVNLAEEDARAFNDEFKQSAHSFFRGNGFSGNGRQAIENGGGSGKRSRDKYNVKINYKPTGGETGAGKTGGGESTPIITIPDDDEDEYAYRRGRRTGGATGGSYGMRHEVPSGSGTGPIIRELNDDEAMMEVNNNNGLGRESKRHKGLFGKFK